MSDRIECVVKLNRIIYPKHKVERGQWASLALDIISTIKGEPRINRYGNLSVAGTVPTLNYGMEYYLTAEHKPTPQYPDSYEIIAMNEKVNLEDPIEQRLFLDTILTDAQVNNLYAHCSDPFALLFNRDVEGLTKIKGIGESTAKRLISRFDESQGNMEAYVRFADFGMKKETVDRLVEEVGSTDVLFDMIKDNPYNLIEYADGFGWKKADDLALNTGMPRKDIRRIKAAIKHYFYNLAWTKGSSWSTGLEMAMGVFELLDEKDEEKKEKIANDITQDDIRKGLYELLDEEILWRGNNTDRLGLKKMYDLEKEISEHLKRLASSEKKIPYLPIESVIKEAEEEYEIEYTDEQKAAVNKLLENQVCILTGSGGCLDGETEFFTDKGWKKIRDYQEGDRVLQYLPDGTTEFVMPLQYHKYPCDMMYHVHNKSNSINQIISPEHNVAYRSSKGNICKISAKELVERHQKTPEGFYGSFITTFQYNGKGIPLSNEQIRVMCAVICDGHFHSQKSTWCRINLKKQRKKERLRAVLQAAGIEYKEACWNKKDPGYTNFSFYAPLNIKEFTCDWYDCNQEQLQTIIDEILYWDGSIYETGKRSFSTINKNTADFVQFAFSACGYRSTIRSSKRDGRKYEFEYTVVITQNKNSRVSLANKDGKEEIKIVKPSDGFKYCFTVPSHLFVIRYGDRICITGNSGKTSVVALALKALNTLNFAQTALSGRAASRLGEVTNSAGETIHRLLGYKNREFTYDEEYPLPHSIIIVDEISMVGAELFLALLKAIRTGSKLIMIGDDGQLESIGLCNIFKDMLDSGEIPVARLTKIHRQAAKSAIITEAMKVRNQQQLCVPGWVGEEVRGELQDLELNVYNDMILTQDKIIDAFKRTYEQHPHINDIQIVVPMRSRGEACTQRINDIVQSIVNPNGANPKDIVVSKTLAYTLREGDKVIVNSNYYQATRYEVAEDEDEICPVFNGNRGIVYKILPSGIIIDFEQWGRIFLPEHKANIIELGYALSCHKLQGSEAPYVIVGIDMGSWMLLTKEWLYTAITRAKKYCIVCAEAKALSKAISTSNISKKKTLLKEMLNGAYA